MEVNLYLGIFLLYIVPILILLEILCYYRLPKFRIVPHKFHDNMYHTTARYFLIFYKKLKVERKGCSRWDNYCYRERISSYEEAKSLVRKVRGF